MAHTSKTNGQSDGLEPIRIVSTNLYGNTPPLAKLKLKPTQQSHVSIKKFSNAPHPKGFAIHISPDPEPGSIVTQVTHLGNAKNYELILMIANYGNKAISVEVWQI